jgi:AraC family transcriptional regulator
LENENIKRAQLIEEYKARINRVQDYIEINLDKEFTLDELALASGFSKHHFARLYYSMTGETLFEFIQRLRLEKAATFLLSHPLKPVTEICYDVGFSSPQAFAKGFKKYFNASASEYRKSNTGQTNSNHGKLKSITGKETDPFSNYYVEYKENSHIWRIKVGNEEKNVTVKDLNEFTITYVRHMGPYKGDGALFERLINKLCSWAGPRGILSSADADIVIVYHDNPDITDESKLRTSVGVVSPENTEVSGEIGIMTIPKGRYAIGRFNTKNESFEEAWKWMYASWLPQSGYQPDDKPVFESYPKRENEFGADTFTVDICIPVKPL